MPEKKIFFGGGTNILKGPPKSQWSFRTLAKLLLRIARKHGVVVRLGRRIFLHYVAGQRRPTLYKKVVATRVRTAAIVPLFLGTVCAPAPHSVVVWREVHTLANMIAAVGHSVIFCVAFLAQAFVFATKTKGKVVSMRTVCGEVRSSRCMLP